MSNKLRCSWHHSYGEAVWLTGHRCVQTICSQADRALTWPSMCSHIIDIWSKPNCSGFIVACLGIGLCASCHCQKGPFSVRVSIMYRNLHHTDSVLLTRSCSACCVRSSDSLSLLLVIVWGNSHHPIQRHCLALFSTVYITPLMRE